MSGKICRFCKTKRYENINKFCDCCFACEKCIELYKDFICTKCLNTDNKTKDVILRNPFALKIPFIDKSIFVGVSRNNEL